MYLPILLSSFGFIGFFIWYLAAENAATRRAAGLGAIAASLLTCGVALYPLSKTIILGLDLQGGTEFLAEVQDNPDAQALEQASSVIRKRLDVFGGREIVIQPEGTNRLKIQIPGLKGNMVPDVQKQITQAAKLELRLVPPNSQAILQSAMANGGKLPYEYALDYEILPLVEKDAHGVDQRSLIVVNRQASITGKHLTKAYRTIGQFGLSQVDFQLDDVGTKAMADMCRNYPGRQMAIVLCVLAMVAVVVGMDVLFSRKHFWPRLLSNVGIVLVFGAFYLRFLKRS